MDEGLLEVLRAHNPWLDAPERQRELLTIRLPRSFVPRSASLEVETGRAVLVVGPRQAGKSTWILEELSRTEAPVLILNCEEPRVRELGSSPARALRTLEEVQHLREAALFLKGIVDLAPDRKIIATGSSSFALQARTRESLAGRVRRVRLLPFSLGEITHDLPSQLVPAIADAKKLEHWNRLLAFGGYPDPWLSEEPAPLLRLLVESIVLRDASDLFTLERPDAFRRLLELAAADIGNLVNLSSWASIAHISSGTVSRYLEIARDAHLLHLVPPFAGGRRAELTSTPKVYFIDPGLRNALFAGFSPLDRRADRGALWENGVYSELAKRLRLLDEVRHWRTANGAEVDFVVRRGDRLVAIEVKATALQQPKISRAARSFAAAYRPSCLAVVNASLSTEIDVAGVPVRFIRPWELDQALDDLDS